MSAPTDAVVIGAGPNGLVAAALLGKSGRRVVVLDAAEDVGGHTRAIEFAPGFRAPLEEDCGWVPPAVDRALALGYDKLTRMRRGHSMSVAAPEGEFLMLRTDPAAAAGVIRKHSARDAARWAPFVERLHRFSRIIGELYQMAPPDIATTSIAQALPLLNVGRKLRALGRSDLTEFLRVMPMSIQDLVDDTFESELLKAALASCAVRDLQQGPRSGGTAFNLLHYMVGAGLGSVRARMWFLDGPDAFAREAAAAARGHGVEIRLQQRVERILTGPEGVRGVMLAGGEEIAAPMVIATTDPQRTLLDLVDPVWLDPEFLLAVRNIKMRGCTAYVCYAIAGEVEDASRTFVSTVSLTATTTSLEKAADAAKYGVMSPEPHVEFFAPTLRWRHLAPAGKHVVVARVQYAPYALSKGTWDTDRGCALMEKVTAMIARVFPGFTESILHSAVITPPDLEERFGLTKGAITHGELTLDQILFMRPVPGWGRYAMPIDGLYLGGNGAHPGPGILGGAGYLAAKAALATRRRSTNGAR